MSGSAKVALITGSTSGIGLATAHALAKNGVDVIVTGFGDEATITGIVNEIKTRYGVNVNYVAADLSRESDIDSLWSAVVDIYPDGVDILVNNAGLYYRGPVDSFSNENWNQTMAVMLTAPFHLTKLCVPAMKKKGRGRIVNMSSVAGFIGAPNWSAYCTAKHGIIGLTKVTALETAAHGITCNAVCPGFVQTPLMENVVKVTADQEGVSTEDVHNKFLSLNASGKLITAQQVAEMVEFLCLSNASSQMTGSSYLMDCGFTAQ